MKWYLVILGFCRVWENGIDVLLVFVVFEVKVKVYIGIKVFDICGG